jgi:hypothetical protein
MCPLVTPVLDLPALVVGLSVILDGMIVSPNRSTFANDWTN